MTLEGVDGRNSVDSGEVGAATIGREVSSVLIRFEVASSGCGLGDILQAAK